jgi:phosphoserine aminotransferase
MRQTARRVLPPAHPPPAEFTPDHSHECSFSAGPAVLPEAVLAQAAAEMLDWRGSGMSVMEMSHRGKEFIGIAAKAEADLRALLAIPTDYCVLFLQGGAIAENAIVPMNLLAGRATADYVNTGDGRRNR